MAARLCRAPARSTLHAPLAIMMVRQRRSPLVVATSYPPSVRCTRVTVVCVRTGGLDNTAKREMKSITSRIVI
jgi:hypothetical protein